MAQILVFGASTAYGVGGSRGGWPDLLKEKLHSEMYADRALPPEKHEIYNLCVPGATLADIEQRFETELGGYSKGRELIVVIELGGNDAKAADSTDNYVNTPESFSKQLERLIKLAKGYTSKIVVVGLQPIDESKNNPRINPNTGKQTYWTSARMKLFEGAIKEPADRLGVSFVPIFDSAAQLNWQKEYLFDDGLHPNNKGHQWLLERIMPVVMEQIGA